MFQELYEQEDIAVSSVAVALRKIFVCTRKDQSKPILCTGIKDGFGDC